MRPARSEDHTMVFVSGLHRSGTSALARCLARHPDTAGLTGTGVPEDEGQHLQTVYPTGEDLGGPGRFALDARAHLTEDSPLATDEAAARLWAAWQPYWADDRPLLVEKSPPHLLMTRFLSRLFPSSVYLVITRNPIVVSLSTSKWTPGTPQSALMEHWFAAYDTFLADRALLPKTLLIAYEDLTRRPEQTMRQVADFLGLDTPPPHDEIAADRSQRYESLWRAMAASSNPVIRASQTGIVSRFGQDIAEYGYDVTDLGHASAVRRPT